MSNSNMYQHNSNISSKQNDFVENLERASNTVKEWPEWKKNVWGPVIIEDKGCCIKNK